MCGFGQTVSEKDLGKSSLGSEKPAKTIFFFSMVRERKKKGGTQAKRNRAQKNIGQH
ncbi:MAG: hypothetical protein WBA61_01830 [Aequorivita sp.]